jgi:hypothetical protein
MTDTKMMIIHHSGVNNGYTFFPGNDDNLPFSKMIKFMEFHVLQFI